MRIMAIDYGDARTGVALSDPTGFLAGQTFLIKSRKQEVVLEELAALVQRQGAQELVMGYPRNMDGTLGPRAEKYAAFARRLEEATGLPVHRFLAFENGGGQQIAARIAYNEIDMVLCFDDPNKRTTHEDILYIAKLCDKNNIPIATNLACAEMLILGLARGDLDWRDIVNPKTKPFTA